MRGLGSLVFWALLSLSAVVVSSYGQTPTMTPNATVTATASGPIDTPLPTALPPQVRTGPPPLRQWNPAQMPPPPGMTNPVIVPSLPGGAPAQKVTAVASPQGAVTQGAVTQGAAGYPHLVPPTR